METLLANLIGKPRRVTRNGREHLVASATLIVPGVLAGSLGPLFYPPDELAKNHQAWNGMPIVVRHPTQNGVYVSGRDPDVLEQYGIGSVYRATANGKLAAEAWFDVEATRNYDRRNGTDILPRLDRGEKIELSTGLLTTNEPVPGTHNGRAYTHVARNYRPDHLALLLDEKGACSVGDGCGFNVNQGADPTDSLLSELDGLIGVNVVGQVRSKVTGWFKQYGAGAGKGPVHEAAQDGAMTLTDEDRAQGADAARQFASAGHNPASWVQDEAIWERAKKAAQKYEGDDTYYAVVTHIYKQMGGGIGEKTENTLTTNEDSDMNRQATIQWLTTNCDCWKGKEKVLENKEAFSDEDLTRLKTVAEKAQQTEAVANAARAGLKALGATEEQLTANAMPAFIKEKIKAKEGKEEEDEEEDEGKKKPTKNVAVKQDPPKKPPTVNEWFASAPPEVQSAVRNAMEIEKTEREKLVQQIIANGDYASDEERQADAADLMKEPLGNLRRQLRRLGKPRVTENVDALAPLYVGAGGTVDTGRHEAELLDLPVMNWSDEKK